MLALGGTAVLLVLSFGPAEAATTFTVNRTGDAGDMDITDDRCDSTPDTGRQCTLRAAIEEANDTAGDDTIAFNIGGTATVKTISPASALPTITDTLTVDGYTQAGASPNTLAGGNDADLRVQLDGSGAGADGLTIVAADCTIKGLIIRRFDFDGVVVSGAGATGNRVEGNFIGVNRDGITGRGNGGGVFIDGDSNTVGGTAPATRNVISGNDQSGVIINEPEATDNKIEGNYIGTSADGAIDLGNDAHGVHVISAVENTIGGTAAGARNVISGNGGYGVMVQGFGASGNKIEGNYIGTTAGGSSALGNDAAGVSLQSADNTAIGGTPEGAGNRIAHNGADGISVVVGDSAGNYILSNSIFSNGELGIDLVGGTEGSGGVTANDPGDPDIGPNDLQNFPHVSSATRSSATGAMTISGKLNSNPSQDYVIQCYLSNGADASGYGEGSRLLDTATTSTNVNGSARFSCVSSLPLLGQQPGRTVSATATNVATGDTSEFSRSRSITTGP